ncbi:hypothetical protein NBRC110019_19890 [Neptunitalea chrysea]|uniref:UspA domain-containing protein n=1 Tax=Neptunitalea chrysea TaxID=1647581 RepID=A0A9W6B7Y8_9FLAO|nr:universal stress protein [Neptunitalea chrysea]GLB52949.1 hypothetical protein NBRC110019_19890 [Neptunitalea chrysea]
MITTHYNTIGIGIAFSPNLKANIYEAARLALCFNARLVLIHVGNRTTQKEVTLKEIIAPFKELHLEYKVVYELGDPVEVILNAIKVKKIDLLVLGALQREKLVKYYVGSIARKITRSASCSVLLLIKPSVERVPCKNIVVNGLSSPKTEATIATSFYVSHKLEARKITIVEEISQQKVQVKVEDDKTLRKATIVKERLRLREESRVKKIVTQIPEDYKKNIRVKTQSIFGRRGYSIGHYAQLMRADLLVMNGSNHTSFWDRFFTHDLEYILRELPTDVLVV